MHVFLKENGPTTYINKGFLSCITKDLGFVIFLGKNICWLLDILLNANLSIVACFKSSTRKPFQQTFLFKADLLKLPDTFCSVLLNVKNLL